MLNRRSQNIIFLCKGRHSYENITDRKALKRYMSVTCYGDESEKDFYTDNILIDIVREVVLDFMRNANEGHHSQLLYHYFEASKRYVDLDAWITALQLIQVKEKNKETDDYEFINGFSQLEVLKEKYPETEPDELMYPDFVKALDLSKNFDMDENIIYDNNVWKIIRFLDTMKVQIGRSEEEDSYTVKDVSIFDIRKLAVGE